MGWVVYILQCKDATLYTGVTNDLGKRLKAHEAGKGARYTRGRAPFVVRYVEGVSDKSAALSRELEIKKLSKRQKLGLMS